MEQEPLKVEEEIVEGKKDKPEEPKEKIVEIETGFIVTKMTDGHTMFTPLSIEHHGVKRQIDAPEALSLVTEVLVDLISTQAAFRTIGILEDLRKEEDAKKREPVIINPNAPFVGKM